MPLIWAAPPPLLAPPPYRSKQTQRISRELLSDHVGLSPALVPDHFVPSRRNQPDRLIQFGSWLGCPTIMWYLVTLWGNTESHLRLLLKCDMFTQRCLIVGSSGPTVRQRWTNIRYNLPIILEYILNAANVISRSYCSQVGTSESYFQKRFYWHDWSRRDIWLISVNYTNKLRFSEIFQHLAGLIIQNKLSEVSLDLLLVLLQLPWWHRKALTQWPPFLNVVVLIRSKVCACRKCPSSRRHL